MERVKFMAQIGETEIDDKIYDYSGMEYSDVIKEFEKKYGKKSKGRGMQYAVDNECTVLTIYYEDGHAVEYKVKM